MTAPLAPTGGHRPGAPSRRHPWAWLPSPFLKGSLAFHVVVAAVLLVWPALWPWALALLILNHLVISASGLVPRGSLLGPNLTRLPGDAATRAWVAITIDDGPDPAVTPAVLDLLDAHGARATFFCIGTRVAAHPELAREIVRRGHSIENHTLRHVNRFSVLGPRTMHHEIAGAQAVIESTVGVRPSFVRAPAGLRNPFFEPIVTPLGLKLASWTRRGFDTVARDPERVSRRLLRRLAAGDILLLHDGQAARTARGVPVILEVLPGLLAALDAAGLRSVTLHEAFDGATTRPDTLARP